jgi:hypothetical protein
MVLVDPQRQCGHCGREVLERKQPLAEAPTLEWWAALAFVL